jgi:FtsP/CotA-like multicopper oxidase with cupredoxin domain
MTEVPSRRDFLKMTAVATASFALPSRALDLAAIGAAPRPFSVPLTIPPVMKPVRSDGERDYYEVAMREARVQIVPGKRTTIWGFDGRFPGPTFKVRRDREIVVRRINKLGVPTTTHLHGGKVPWRSDGHPSLAIRPGEAYDFVYPNAQDAATLWYHDHLCKQTSRNNYMGLSGLYIIEDPAEDELNLPRGKHDIPLVLQDRSFRKDGSLRFKDKVDRLQGSVYLVNGRPNPYLKVANRKYRFRIVNASHSRAYQLALDSGNPLTQIASDQGLLAVPSLATTIPLWPAERAEVVVDFSAYPVGTQVVLQDAPDPTDPSRTRPIMRFDVEREEADDSSLPATLRSIDRLLPTPDVIQRELVLNKDLDANRWVINGKPFDAGRIDIEPRLGDTEVWTFVNESTKTHPMHIHLVRFQVLDRSDSQPAPGELGWKDTVRVDPSARVRVIMRFEGFAGRYMFHCHNLAHEDHSMMGQMLVRPAGAEERVPAFAGGYVGPPRGPAQFRCDLTR